jgi:hypothetical protein
MYSSISGVILKGAVWNGIERQFIIRLQIGFRCK